MFEKGEGVYTHVGAYMSNRNSKYRAKSKPMELTIWIRITKK